MIIKTGEHPDTPAGYKGLCDTCKAFVELEKGDAVMWTPRWAGAHGGPGTAVAVVRCPRCADFIKCFIWPEAI